MYRLLNHRCPLLLCLEAVNLFRLLDSSMLGALKFQQIYLAVVLVAALGARQLTRPKGHHFATSEGD